MAVKVSNSVSKNLSNLKSKVTKLVNDSSALNLPEIRKELEYVIQSKLDTEDNNATLVVLNNHYVPLGDLSDEIIELLNKLKDTSYQDYLTAFKFIFDEINILLYNEDFNVLPDKAAPDNPYYCFGLTCYILGEYVFRPLNTNLIVDRAKDFSAAYNLPEHFSDLKQYIVKGLYELELFINDSTNNLVYYNIPRAIEKFNSVRLKVENNPKEALILLDRYWEAINTLNQTLEDGLDDEKAENKVLATMQDELHTFSDRMLNLFTEEEVEALAPKEKNVLEIIDAAIENEVRTSHAINNKEETFENVISPAKADFILNMLEHLGITVNGKAEVSDRKKSALRGIVEASIENNILPPKSLATSCFIIADRIGLELKAKLNKSYVSDDYRSRAVRYIEKNYKPVLPA